MIKKTLTFFILLILFPSCIKDPSPRPAIDTKPSEGKIRIALLTSLMGTNLKDGTYFFTRLYDFTESAADNLGIEFKTYGIPYEKASINEKIHSIVSEFNPQAFIIIGGVTSSLNVFKILEEIQIPTITVNTPILSSPGDMIIPRGKYKYWIGEVVPEDEHAGYLLAKRLISHASARRIKKINMVAIAGSFTDNASRKRIIGLKRAVSESKDVILHQIFSSGNFDYTVARDKFFYIKKSRYPQTSVLWCGNDTIAFGVLDGAGDINLVPGKDIILGGIDWSEKALKLVRDEEMTVNIGGHFMDGAWALVLLYDYLKGLDFVSEGTHFRSRMILIDKNNVDSFGRIVFQKNWHKLNFRKFSKVINPEIKKYSFSIEKLLY